MMRMSAMQCGCWACHRGSRCVRAAAPATMCADRLIVSSSRAATRCSLTGGLSFSGAAVPSPSVCPSVSASAARLEWVVVQGTWHVDTWHEAPSCHRSILIRSACLPQPRHHHCSPAAAAAAAVAAAARLTACQLQDGDARVGPSLYYQR